MNSGENYPANGSSSAFEDWSSLAGPEQESRPEELPTPEQKKAELSFDKVSELSTEEYLELWRRLNPFYVTHVTRQGIRDHCGMFYHSGGLGDFQNGMKAMLGDGKTLKTKAGANFGLMPGFTEDDAAVALDRMLAFEDFDGVKTPEEVLSLLPVNASLASADPWSDEQAVHFGQHTVLDEYYGGETGNEAFVVFPTDVIASQCDFGGHMHRGLNTAQVDSERKWNDLFVWPEGGKIPLDAGFVFLPKSQMVDRETGSKYATHTETAESGETILVSTKDEERIQRFTEWIKNLTTDSPEVVAAEGGDEEPIAQILREMGIPEHCVGDMVNYSNVYTILSFIEKGRFDSYAWQEEIDSMAPEEVADRSIRRYLAGHNADIKNADSPITAQEYWEQYFASHPEQRPAHVVYYDGDPSEAVRNFLKENGIVKELPTSYSYSSLWLGRRNDSEQSITGPGDSTERDGILLGFDDHCLSEDEVIEKTRSEHARFNEIALRKLKEKEK